MILLLSWVAWTVVVALLYLSWKATPKPVRYPKVRIKVRRFTRGTEVWVDDTKVAGLRNVEFDHPAGELPLVVLTLLSNNIEISGESDVVVAEPVAAVEPVADTCAMPEMATSC